MAEMGDVTVNLRVRDEATPVLRRIRRELFWYRLLDQWMPLVLLVGAGAFAAIGFLICYAMVLLGLV